MNSRAMSTVLAALAMSAAASAQTPYFQESPRRPAFSPYLNLTRSGGGLAQNYYGLVRPELEFRRNDNLLRNDTQALAYGLAAASTAPGELQTGHPVGYMTHLKYYGTNKMGGATLSGAYAARSPAPPPGPAPSPPHKH